MPSRCPGVQLYGLANQTLARACSGVGLPGRTTPSSRGSPQRTARESPLPQTLPSLDLSSHFVPANIEVCSASTHLTPCTSNDLAWGQFVKRRQNSKRSWHPAIGQSCSAWKKCTFIVVQPAASGTHAGWAGRGCDEAMQGLDSTTEIVDFEASCGRIYVCFCQPCAQEIIMDYDDLGVGMAGPSARRGRRRASRLGGGRGGPPGGLVRPSHGSSEDLCSADVRQLQSGFQQARDK